MAANRRFLLVRRPSGRPVPEDFELATQPVPEPADGQALVRNHYASLDPAIRGWMDDAPSYLPPIALGAPVRATTVGVVERSRTPALPEGAWVTGLNALEDYSLVEGDGFTQLIDPSAVPSVTAYLSVVGTIGATAWFALRETGRPQAGETLLVSGAAGAVGSLVGQLGKAMGLRTVGVAGGPAKCARLIERYGYDAAIDYRGKDAAALAAAIRTAAPGGIDIHFENVGGPVLDAALATLNPRGRVVLCGLISEYNSAPRGTTQLWQLIVKGARIEGFILTHYVHRFGEALPELARMLRTGSLVADEHVEEGLENALPVFLRLFDGTNDGKLILKIATEH